MKKEILSIVVPCYNESETTESSFRILQQLCNSWKEKTLIADYELLFVNDGSTDDTFDILKKIYNKNKNVSIVNLRKNSGFQAALTAGLFESTGDIVVSIDADLQDDPEKIEEMIQKYHEGFEMVLGIRKDRSTDTFFKRLFAETYYKILRKIGVKSVYNHGDFRLLSRGIIDDLKKFPERVRYLRSLIFEIEPRYACVYYARTKRKFGQSKFTFSKSLSLAIDGVTSFTAQPIRLLSVLGFFMFILSIVCTVIVFFGKFYWHLGIPGWASLALIVLFFGGIQNLSLGVVGEYVSKIYIENKARPLYLVRDIYTHGK